MANQNEWGRRFAERLRQAEDLRRQAPQTQALDAQAALGLDPYEILANRTQQRDPRDMSEMERLIHEGDYETIRAKYGEEVLNTVRSRMIPGAEAYRQDMGARRSGLERGIDLATAAPQGLASMGFGLGSLGAGIFSSRAGTKVAQVGQAADDAISSVQSERLAASQRLHAARMSARERANAAQQQREIEEGSSSFMAGLRRIGRDIRDSVGSHLQDSTLLAQGTTDAAVSMTTSAGTAALARAGLTAATKGLAKKATTQAAKDQLAKRVSTASWMGAVGALEGGGTFQETALNVMDRSPEELMESSGDYRAKVTELQLKGRTQAQAFAEAQEWLAGRTGLRAAGPQAVAGAALSRIAMGGQRPTRLRPLKGAEKAAKEGTKAPRFATLRAIGRDTGEEILEEGSQGFTGTLAQNLALRGNVDSNQDLLKGVGAAVGEGALYAGPGVGVMKGIGAVRWGLNAKQHLARKGNEIIKKEQARSTVSPEAVQKVTRTLQEAGESSVQVMHRAIDAAEIAPEAKTAAKDQIDRMIEATTKPPAPTKVQDQLPPDMQEKYGEPDNRFDALEKAASLVLDAKEGSPEQALAAQHFAELLGPLAEHFFAPSYIDALLEDKEAGRLRAVFAGLIENATNSENTKKAFAIAQKIAKEGKTADPVIQAQLDPAHGDLDAVQQILEEANEGRINLTPSELAALEANEIFLQARAEVAADLEGSDVAVERVAQRQIDKRVLSRREMVSGQAIDGEGVGEMPSALEHVRRFTQAVQAGNQELAQGFLEDFALFVEHMQNKVEALNAHLEDPSQPYVPYQQLILKDGRRQWKDSSTNAKREYKGAFINQKSTESIVHAQTVHGEARLLHGLLSRLAEAHPDLQVKVPPAQGLNPILLGNPQEVVQRLANRNQEAKKATPKQKPAPAPIKQQETPKQEAPRAEDPQQAETSKKATKPPVEKPAQKKAPVEKAKPASPAVEKPTKKAKSAPLVEAQKIPEAPPGLVQTFNEMSDQERLDRHYLDSNSGLPNTRAFEDFEADDGTLVVQIGFEGPKFFNDHATEGEVRGHDKGNQVYREVGRAVGASLQGNQFGAKVGGDFGVKNVASRQDAENLLRRVRRRAKVHGLQITMGVGKTYAEAAQAHIAAKERAEKAGRRALRGERPLGLQGDVNELTFGDGTKAQVELPASLVQRHQEMMQNPEEVFRRIYVEEGSGLLTGEGFYGLPRKKFQLKVDLNWLKQLNTVSEASGDLALLEFGKMIVALGGRALDFAHVSGDEYVAQSDHKASLEGFAKQLANHAAQVQIPIFNESTGEQLMLNGLTFGYGVGPNDAQAESALIAHKQQQEAQGLRGVHAEKAFAERLDGRDQRDGGEGRQAEDRDSDLAPAPEQGSERGVADVFPAVAKRPSNLLAKVFRLRLRNGEPSTRTQGMGEGVVAFVQEALKDQDSLNQTTGKKIPRAFVDGARNFLQGILRTEGKARYSLGGVMATLETNLEAYLDRLYKKDEPYTIRDIFLQGEGKPMEHLPSGKVLNLVEVGEDGQVRYNQELLQLSALAGLQWWLTMSQRQTQVYDEDAKAITELDDPPRELINLLNQGMGGEEAVRSLGSMLLRFWGLTAERSADIAFAEGIATAMAGEVLRALTEHKLLSPVTVAYGKFHDPPNKKVTIRHVPTVLEKGKHPVYSRALAIEEVIVKEPEQLSFYGPEAEIPVAKTQGNNRQVPLSERQREVLDARQRQTHILNAPMVNVVAGMGREGILAAFGTEVKDPTLFNKNHLDSVEGQNLGLIGALEQFFLVFQEMEAEAAGRGIPIDEVEKRYAYTVTNVNRFMMVGRHNPQSSQLMRQLLLPTRSTLDLSQPGEHLDAFYMAVGQALDFGAKLNKHSAQQVVEMTLAKLKELEPVRKILRDWYADRSKPFPAKEFRAAQEAQGIESTPLALHALLEVNRMESADVDLSQFQTAFYLEIDGQNNGVFNSLGLLDSGDFSAHKIDNYKRGGLSFGVGVSVDGELVGKTADALFAEVGSDLYEVTTILGRERVSERLGLLGEVQPEAVARAEALFDLMELLGLDVEVREQGGEFALTISRGAAKTPMMVRTYGSGAGGIANQIAKDLLDAIYGEVSAAIQAHTRGEKVDAKFGRALRSLDSLVRSAVGTSPDGEIYFAAEPDMAPLTDRLADKNAFRQFTITSREQQNLRSHIQLYFVEPMIQAISDVQGEEIEQSSTMVREVSQIQSVVLRNLFQNAIEDLIEKKKESGEGGFLSEEELQGIWRQLRKVAPRITMDGQPFLLTGTKILELARGRKEPSRLEISRALDNTFKNHASVFAPADPGVAAIPRVVQGMGDARMMREIYADGEGQNSLDTYDGMSLPLDRLREEGQNANRGALHAFTGNIFAGMRRSLERALTDPQVLAELRTNDALIREAISTLRLATSKEASAMKIGVARDMLQHHLNDLLSRLDVAENRMAAKNRVLARAQLSMDQMAGAYAPFVQEGEIRFAEGATSAEIAARLNEEFLKELKKANIRPRQPIDIGGMIIPQGKEKIDGVKITRLFHSKPKPSSGVTVLSQADVPALLQGLDLSPARRALVSDLLAGNDLEGWMMVVGSLEQVRAHHKEHGLPFEEVPPSVQGITIPAAQIIYLMTDDVETAVHELVHATTYAAVEAHYAGRGSPRTAKAIRRLEQLMKRFLEEAPEDAAAKVAWGSAALTILQMRLQGDRAGALNEFMAWTLANQELSDWYGEVKEGSRFKRIVQAALRATKSLILGPQPDRTNFIGELRFQTKILAEESPSTGTLLRENALYHAPMNPRLATLRREFTRKVADRFREFGEAKGDPPTYLPAVQLARQAQHHFEMSPEEIHIFEMIVAAAATEQGLNPQGMREANKVFVQVLRKLDATDFIPEDVEQGSAAYEDARQIHNAKVDFLLGQEGTLSDGYQRSSLLPVFLALSLTNDEFRAALARLELPRGSKSEAEGFDRIVENLGHAALDRISQRLGGLKKPGNVLEAMDQLGTFLLDAALSEREALQVFNRGVNSLDAFIAKGLDTVGRRALEAADAGEGNAVGEAFLRTVAALTSDEGFDSIAEKVLAFSERTNLRLSIRELLADMVGRTESIGKVYDRAKVVKSTVSRARQGFIEVLPRNIKGKFSKRLSPEQWDSLHHVMGRSDLASLATGRTTEQVLQLAADPKAAQAEAQKLEGTLQQAYSSQEWKILDQKITQLARYMRTGIAGPGLLGNAYALARLLGQNIKERTEPTEALEQAIDQLVTLRYLQETDLGDFASLVQEEAEGMGFALNFLRGLRLSEGTKAQTALAKANHIKGRIPEDKKRQGQLIVAKDERLGELRALGFERVGVYEGSNIETGRGKRSYFFAPQGVRIQYTQGIVQNVDQTAYGVQQDTGFLVGETAGIITDPTKVRFLAKRMHLENVEGENLRPIFDGTGAVVAFERMLHPAQLQRLQVAQDLAQTMGRWAGRQTEEIFAQEANRALVKDLADAYREDIEKDPKNKDLYVDLFNTTLDPIVAEAVRLIPPELHEAIAEHFPDETFMVRKSMLNTVLGYRNPTVGDFWTGNTRWSPETQKDIRNVLVGLLGIDAYKMLTAGERNVQALMYLAKTNIVVRSVLIPAVNLVSTYLQLITRGPGMVDAAKEMVKKGVEVESYQQLFREQVRLEAEITAAMDLPRRKVRLEAELKTNQDMQRRLSIWPLIEAGELSTIADLGLQEEVRDLQPGNMVEHISQQVNKLSPRARGLARQGLIGKDTALFRALMKSVQYGDFVGKAVLYDHLTKREGKSKEEALAQITEEFVNYDIPPGRTRGYVESMGILWFYNYKLRTAKIGLSQARNNPLRTLLVTLMPAPYGIGTPLTENVFAKLFEGTLGYSIGPSMLLQGAGLHPLYSTWSD